MAERKTILQIVSAVAPIVGVQRPSTATGSTDRQIIQMVALASLGGQELAARRNWLALTQEQTFSALAAEDQGLIDGTIVPAGAGFDYILNDTIWNRTSMLSPGGPLSPSRWQAAKATSASIAPWSQYRIRGGKLYFYPVPSAGDTIAFEYKTRYWVSNTTGDEFRSEFTADSDFPLLDSRLLQLDLIWRWKAAKGLEYGQDFNNFENAYADAANRDGAPSSLDLGGYDADDYRPILIAPPGNWNL